MSTSPCSPFPQPYSLAHNQPAQTAHNTQRQPLSSPACSLTGQRTNQPAFLPAHADLHVPSTKLLIQRAQQPKAFTTALAKPGALSCAHTSQTAHKAARKSSPVAQPAQQSTSFNQPAIAHCYMRTPAFQHARQHADSPEASQRTSIAVPAHASPPPSTQPSSFQQNSVPLRSPTVLQVCMAALDTANLSTAVHPFVHQSAREHPGANSTFHSHSVP